ncbi:MAG: hypothetical protein ACJ768_12865 [Gaiellaceae bacterium]
MTWFLVGVSVAVLLWLLRHEFRRGGSLFPLFDEVRAEQDRLFDELVELPAPGWSVDDVLRTVAEIEAL